MEKKDIAVGSESAAVFRLSLRDIEADADGRRASLSRRERAIPMRQVIDEHLRVGDVVELDCEGVDATQSFMDELIGLVVLERGGGILSQIRFKKCSPDMKAIIQFVVSDRAAQHDRDPHFHAPR